MKIVKEQETYILRQFKRLALIYDITEFFMGNLRNMVAEKIDAKNTKVIDVACGTGSQSIAFAKKGFSVIGIDISPDMLKKAEKKIKSEYKIKFIQGNVTKIPYKNSKFDVSSISFGLHEMPKKLILVVLKEMKRVTKKNGKIIIVDYHKPRNPILAWISYRIFRFYESKYYGDFFNTNIKKYLSKVNLKIISKETLFFNTIQIVECINSN
ncbi:MAG: class I SAM-dependent methyltransferase [Bacteroidetes bacterium]|nr:class I SAM-dependent methyltransferase [Bacteroidota bacterium]MBL7169685.1 class I SAM-dependent methyltransferase [Candidatus Aenigmarchaeota archaeon]